MKWQLVQAVSLPSPCKICEKLQQIFVTLSSGRSGYWKWMDGLFDLFIFFYQTSASAFERGLNDSRCSGLRGKTAIINVASAYNKLPENWKVDKWPVITHLADLMRRYCAERINDVTSSSQNLSTKENLPGSSVSKARPLSSGSLSCRRCTILPWIKLALEEITSLVNAVH